MEKSESINELAAALAKAQGQIEGAKKDTANPFFKSKYADLSSVWDACRKALSENSLSVVQIPDEAASGVAIETMLLHSSGQWIKGRYTMPVLKNDAQAVGSAITYARRYALAALVGVAPEDDDGNGAVIKPVNNKESKPANTEKIAAPYPSADFEANKQSWIDLVSSGKKTAQNIIDLISTKGSLTEAQKNLIRSFEPATEDIPQ